MNFFLAIPDRSAAPTQFQMFTAPQFMFHRSHQSNFIPVCALSLRKLEEFRVPVLERIDALAGCLEDHRYAV